MSEHASIAAGPHPPGGPPVVPATAREATDRAAGLLASGHLVALPTETVYGLAADATSPAAVARLYAAKGRPAENPLIVHVSDVAMAADLGVMDETALSLAALFWPGPLTLVVRRREPSPLAPAVTAGGPTVALRLPATWAFRGVIARARRPLAAPSANRSGRLSATTAAAVVEELGEAVALVVDDGPSPLGLESTILSLAGERPEILRPGAIDATALAAVLGRPVPVREAPAAGVLAAPGLMASHYAPRAAVRLDVAPEAMRPGEARLGFGPEPATDGPFFNLSEKGDLAEAARTLYDGLRRLDRSGAGTIAVAPIPNEGVGRAIRDRLARAAAPRPGDAETRGRTEET